MKSPEMKKRRKIHDSVILHGNNPGVYRRLFFCLLLIIMVMLSACSKDEEPVQKKPEILDDTVFRNPLFHQIAFHRFTFRNDLILSLPSGSDKGQFLACLFFLPIRKGESAIDPAFQ